MATINKFTPEELKLARKAGFKRKKPKKPSTKSYSSMENFISRYNEWVKDLKAAASNGRKMEAMKKAIRQA